MINASNKNSTFRLYPALEHFEWEEGLPHMVGEGTGMLNPLLRPVTTYSFETEEHAAQALTKAKQTLALLPYPGTTSVLKESTFMRGQSELYFTKDARLSPFYRASNHAETDELLKEGYNFAGFTWINNVAGKPWTYGSNMYHKLYNDKSVQLAFHPELTQEEIAYAKSAFRQSMPRANPTYESASLKVFSEKADSWITSMKSKLTLAQANKTSTPFYYNFHLDVTDLEKPEYREKLVADLNNMKHLSEVNFEVEVLTKDIWNVRLELGLDMPREESERSGARSQIFSDSLIGASSLQQFRGEYDSDTESEEDEQEEDPELTTRIQEAHLHGYPYFVIVQWSRNNQMDYSYETFDFDSKAELHGFTDAIEDKEDRKPTRASSVAYTFGWQKGKDAADQASGYFGSVVYRHEL